MSENKGLGRIAADAPTGLSSDGSSPQAVSPVPASIPCEWHFIADGEITFPDGALVYALGRLGDVYGPLPVEMFHPDAWAGNMLHASHDLIAVARCEQPWRSVIPLHTSAMEARRAETENTGSVHDSAVVATSDETPDPSGRSA